MKFLVTGGAGFIGREVVRQLASRGDTVVVPVRNEAARARVEAIGGGARAEPASVDDRPAMEALIGRHQPEATIHLAWYARPADYRVSEENLRSLQATVELTELLLRSNCRRLVYSGTCFEYAESGSERVETDPVGPKSLYAACKLAAGAVCAAMAEAAGIAFAWGRVFFPYGPGEDPGRLLPLVAQRLSKGEIVELTDGAQVRDQVHVADVASGFITMADRDAAGTYNISTGVPVTMRQTVETLGELLGRPDLLRFGVRATPEGEPAAMYGDNAKLTALGWKPQFSDVRRGLEASMPYYLGTAGAPSA